MASQKQRHPNLNAILIVGAGLFFGYAAATASPSTIARTSSEMLASASVSISAAVPSNPQNTLATQLHAKEVALAAREEQLQKSESQSAPTNTAPSDRLSVLSLAISLLLLILVGLNFYMDARRAGRFSGISNPFAIDLRRRS